MSNRKPKLPNDWAVVPVSGVAEINPRTTLPPTDADDLLVPLYEMAAIDEHHGFLASPRMVPLRTGRSGKTKFTNNDVLFSKITPCVQNGKSAFVQGVDGGLALGSSEFYVLRSSPALLPQYLFFFVRQQRVVDAAVASFTGTSGRQRVPSTFWDELRIPVPPLPVQARIVAILQKADEIRQKRQEGAGLVEQILPAMYRKLFGEPRANPNRWPIRPLGEHLAETRYGTSKKTREHVKGDPVLRIPNVVQRTIDTDDLKYLKVSQAERDKLLLLRGDILVVRTNGNKDYVGRAAVFDLEEEYLFASYLIRLRLDTEQLNPHYVVAFFATRYGRDEIDVNSRTSAGQYNISATGLKAISIPVPPMSRQLKFLSQYDQWNASKARLDQGVRESECVLHSLMARAFSGELTRQFEEHNAQVIADCQAIEQQLPRVVALELLRRSNANRVEGSVNSGLLVTAIMKLLFLIQMKGSAKRRFYQFVPYHYGPFAKELYVDLEKLQQDGLVEIDNGDEAKTRIRLKDASKASVMAEQLSEELREDVQAVLDEYGGLKHNELLARVYEEFPAYAKKSRRKNVSKKAATKTTKMAAKKTGKKKSSRTRAKPPGA